MKMPQRPSQKDPQGLKKPEMQERMRARIAAIPPRKGSECMEAPGAGTKRGYRLWWVGDGLLYAHRIAWILAEGDIPDGLFVCHRCDNPSCVNAQHLFLGTPKDNTDDRIRKGRPAGPAPWTGALIDARQRAAFKLDVIRGAWNVELQQKYNISAKDVSMYRKRMGLPSAWETRKKR